MIANTMNQVPEKFYAIFLKIVKFITKKRKNALFRLAVIWPLIYERVLLEKVSHRYKRTNAQTTSIVSISGGTQI